MCGARISRLVSCTVIFGIIDRDFGIAGVHPKMRDNSEKIGILGRYACGHSWSLEGGVIMYDCMYVCICGWVDACCVCVCVCVYVCVYVCMCVFTRTHVC